MVSTPSEDDLHHRRLVKERYQSSAQRQKAWKLVQALKRYRPDISNKQDRVLFFMLADDAVWNLLATWAEIKATREPGACNVSRKVKRFTYELCEAGAALRYSDRDEDVWADRGTMK